MAIPLSFGAKTPETQLSMGELIGKMHDVMRHINSLVGKYAAITDPLQRAEIEVQIAEKLFFLQDFTAKFGKSFLNRVHRNALYANKLISGMDIRSLLSRYPNPIVSLESYKKRSIDNLDRFSRESRENMEMWYGLRRYAGNVRGRVRSNISAAVKAVGQKISSLKKQMEAKQKQQLTAKQVEQAKLEKMWAKTSVPSKNQEEEKRRRLQALRMAGFGEREKARR